MQEWWHLCFHFSTQVQLSQVDCHVVSINDISCLKPHIKILYVKCNFTIKIEVKAIQIFDSICTQSLFSSSIIEIFFYCLTMCSLPFFFPLLIHCVLSFLFLFILCFSVFQVLFKYFPELNFFDPIDFSSINLQEVCNLQLRSMRFQISIQHELPIQLKGYSLLILNVKDTNLDEVHITMLSSLCLNEKPATRHSTTSFGIKFN